MAAARGNGNLPASLLFGRANAWAAPLWPAQHDQRRFLRHFSRARCRFRDPPNWTLSPGTLRWRVASASHRYLNSKAWARGFFWSTHDGGRICRASTERRDELFATRRADCDWHFRGWSVHVLDLISFYSRARDANES